MDFHVYVDPIELVLISIQGVSDSKRQASSCDVPSVIAMEMDVMITGTYLESAGILLSPSGVF